tara:strand:- start:56 stop:367 length:312 start_codon:yes stop_codon:yes gene_type:complete
MEKRSEIIQKYALFGSKLRGTEYIENLLQNLLLDMETTENLEKMSVNLAAEWRASQENIGILKESFIADKQMDLPNRKVKKNRSKQNSPVLVNQTNNYSTVKS